MVFGFIWLVLVAMTLRSIEGQVNDETEGTTFNDTQYGIIGGEDAKRGEFPHAALLGYGPNMYSDLLLCGGTLITKRFVLTAGHCIVLPNLRKVTFVALGMLRRLDPPQYFHRYKVNRVIQHPEYNDALRYHDIALVMTEKNIKFIKTVQPACLSHKPEMSSTAIATGWGVVGKDKIVDIMQKVTLEKFTTEECEAQYPPSRLLPQGFNKATQTCYGSHNSIKDTCQGDSGGPLQVRDPESRYCKFAVIGVTSFGATECGMVGIAAIYTRVAYYLQWIESIVGPQELL